MNSVVKAVTLAGMGLTLTSFSIESRFPAAALAALDPGRIAQTLCGARAAGSALVSELLIASAVAAPASDAAPIPLYADLTHSRFPLTTTSAEARRYFSQGLLLAYGFNHAGAVRSFREAQRLDPGCALCWWGEAVALGPNINAPMEERDRTAALDAMDRAMALRDRASPMERALIPADDDVAVLAAEAAMDTTPWAYWEADRKTPIGRSGEAVRLVETVLARNPAHVQAAHLAIHLLEASDPQRAEAAADRLAKPLAPSAAHLVHMPAHIFHARGRYADSIRVNVAAARADEAFIRRANDHSLVRYGYYPHNIHFIVASAQMAGDMGTAVREARRLRTVLDPETSARIAWIQAIDAAPYLAMAQFAAPDAILAMPEPDARLPYARAMRHYARAVAHAQRQDRAAFDNEMGAMDGLARSGGFADMIEQGVPAPDLLALAQAVARGRFAALSGRYEDAAAFYRTAIALEGTLPYQEPSYWSYPVRQSLGAAQFLAGRYEEASRTFREALVQAPHNGWALYGLARSEEARGNRLEAAAARKAFARAWLGKRGWLRMERL